jgi:pimeloyl-ACP methyl ester carboxylesterase
MGLSGFTEHTVLTAEGLALAAFEHVPADLDPSLPPIVLVNGLGGNLITWRHLLAALKPRYRIVTWDYRGLYQSRFDAETRAKVARNEIGLGPAVHAADGLRVLDHFGVDRAVFIGWSMGVQLNFELAKIATDRVAGIIQICGASGRAVATTVLGRMGLKVIPPAMDLFRVAAERHAPWLGRMVGSTLALQVAKAVGMVAPSLDERLAAEIVHDYVRLDFDVYNRILMSLGDHDASGWLPSLQVPALIVAGTRDAMTPLALSQAMAKLIPNAELVVVQGGSHYLPIEFPDALNEAVLRFLGRWPGAILPAQSG